MYRRHCIYPNPSRRKDHVKEKQYNSMSKFSIKINDIHKI